MPIAKIRPTSLIANQDIPAHEVPAEFWTQAENMSFREVYAERIPGFRPIYDANATIGPPQFLLNNVFQGVNYWLYGTDNEVAVTDAAGTHTDLDPASGGPSSQVPEDWSGCELNGFPILNWQGSAGPHSWDRNIGNNVAPLTGWPTNYTCQAIRSFKFYLIALGIGGAQDWPSVALWSDSAAPGNLPTTWTPGAGNDAGSLSFGDTGTGITDGLPLRDQFMVYKTNSTFIMQYIGGTLIFGQRQFLRTTGCLSTNCVAEWQGNHVVMADGDILIHDGNQVRSLVDKATRRTIFSELSQDNFERSYVLTNKNQNEVWVCYPTEGDTYPTKALVWDANSNTTRFKDTVDIFGGLSFRDILIGGTGCPHMAHGNVSETAVTDDWDSQVGTWDAQTRTWDENKVQEASDGLVAIDTDADELVFFDTGNDYSTGTLNARLLRESLDFGDAQVVKLCTEVWPRIVGTAGDVVSIRVGSKFQPDDPISWSDFVQFTIGSDQKIDTFATGRYLSFEFISSDGSPWRLTGFDVNLEQGGRY